eukprot:2877084-Amphidinium_carterae.1
MNSFIQRTMDIACSVTWRESDFTAPLDARGKYRLFLHGPPCSSLCSSAMFLKVLILACGICLAVGLEESIRELKKQYADTKAEMLGALRSLSASSVQVGVLHEASSRHVSVILFCQQHHTHEGSSSSCTMVMSLTRASVVHSQPLHPLLDFSLARLSSHTPPFKLLIEAETCGAPVPALMDVTGQRLQET